MGGVYWLRRIGNYLLFIDFYLLKKLSNYISATAAHIGKTVHLQTEHEIISDLVVKHKYCNSNISKSGLINYFGVEVYQKAVKKKGS